MDTRRIVIGFLCWSVVMAGLSAGQDSGAADAGSPAKESSPAGNVHLQPWPCALHAISPPRKSHTSLYRMVRGDDGEDARAHDAELALQSDIQCLAGQVHDLTQVSAESKGYSDARSAQLNELLEQVNRVLERLSKQVTIPDGKLQQPTQVTVNLPNFQEIERQLRDQAATLKDIAAAVREIPVSGGASPPVPVTVTSLSYATAVSPTPPADAEPRQQIDPTQYVVKYFQRAHVEFALAAVPDPRVPRHRRQYDNAITAINQGMLSQGFVLDGFGFPWSKALQITGAAALTTGAGSGSAGAKSGDKSDEIVEDGRYGLMLFRQDHWRERRMDSKHSGTSSLSTKKSAEDACANSIARPANTSADEVQVRALYLVPETGTYGLQLGALRSALLRIDEQARHGELVATKEPERAKESSANKGNAAVQLSTASPAATTGDVSGAAGRSTCPDPSRVVTMFGPTFSGSMDSIRQVMVALREEQKLKHIDSLRLLAAATTVDTNDQIDATTYTLDVEANLPHADEQTPRVSSAPAPHPRKQFFPIRYVPMARTDRQKLDYLSELSEVLQVPANKVAIVYESTTFGIEACKMTPGTQNPASKLCRSALMLPIPVNIADVRFGLRTKIAAHAHDVGSKMPFGQENSHLPLEDGAENGSEFPESQQSPLTASSTALELEHLIEELHERDARMVVIIATDVRDRLFLIEQINSQVNGALFVDMDTDRLLGHPNFIHATRGTLTLSSSQLTQKNSNSYACNQRPADPQSCLVIRVWSTDEQATLASAMDYWRSDSKLPPPGNQGKPYLYVVSRTGLVSDQDLAGSKALRKVEIICSTVLAILFAVIGIIVCGRDVEGPDMGQWNRRIAGRVFLRLLLGTAAALLLWLVTRSIAVAGLSGVVGLYFVGFPGGAAPQWSRIVVWLGAALLILTATLEVIVSSRWLSLNWEHNAIMPLLIALSGSASGGMDYPVAECVAVLAIIAAMFIAHRVLILLEQNDTALIPALTNDERAGLQRPQRSAGVLILLLALAAALVGPFVFVWTRQVTVFGFWVDLAAFCSLMATTLLAFCLLVAAFSTVTRTSRLCGLISTHLRETHGFDPPGESTDQPLMWNGLAGARPDFIATPVLARPGAGGSSVTELRGNNAQWGQGLNDALHEAPVTAAGNRALYALLAAEVAAYQLCVIGVALMTVFSSLIVYLFPVSDATVLTILNLTALATCGGYAAYQTVSFEGNQILSNVLCNRPQKREWSMSLFAGVAIPFVALAIVVGIGQIPGVLDMGDGLVSALLKWAKVGG